MSVWVLGTGATVSLAGPAASYLLTPVFEEREAFWIRLGLADSFRELRAPRAIGIEFEGRAGYQHRTRRGLLFLVPQRNSPGGVAALSRICTHKGCNVTWSESDNAFACPCHGGRYDSAGRVEAGPPPAPLKQLDLRIDDGSLYVRVEEGLV